MREFKIILLQGLRAATSGSVILTYQLLTFRLKSGIVLEIRILANITSSSRHTTKRST